MIDKMCPVCGKFEFEDPDAYEMCMVCGWFDDNLQRDDHDYAKGYNRISLNEYKKKYLAGELDLPPECSESNSNVQSKEN